MVADKEELCKEQLQHSCETNIGKAAWERGEGRGERGEGRGERGWERKRGW